MVDQRASGERYECRCVSCKAGLKPYTLEHFRRYAADLELDSGEPFNLEPFQADFDEDLFARAEDGRTPRYNELWNVIPEENGKTTHVAILVLYHIEHVVDAFVPVAAASRDQAETLYRQAEGFVLRSARLRDVMVCQSGYRKIRLKRHKHVRIQVFAADADTADSVIYTLAVIDELHRQKNLALYRTWMGKLRKRKVRGHSIAQLIVISTGGEAGSEFEQTRTRLRESAPQVSRRRCFVRAAGNNFVLHDWAIPEKGDPEDLALVKAANPFSGITIESLRAKRSSPTMTLGHWLRYTCNRATRHESAAISEAEWAAAASDIEIPEGAPVDVGFDVGWKWDTTAVQPLWVRDARFRLLGPATVIVPPRNGSSTHPQAIKDAFHRILARNPIRRVVMDITHANDIAAWIRDELGVEVVEHSQADTQAAVDYDRFMEALRAGVLRHSGDSGPDSLTKHAMNAVTKELSADRHKFERKSSSRDTRKQDEYVIDALVAAAMVNSEAGAPAKAIARDLPATSGERPRPHVAGILGRAF